ncbi:hypothetical protein EG327_002507 [Venturia inaequalis]|uniref:Cleavage and polyadenylation specificity factor subunit 2 n=1 Tax=Venturia inaequalis TaxID=5025 RepID=A0A8H3ZAX4_VENIN|nr:hypothetical protein EG327_002507 [Venturia inaequalis]
MFNFTSLLGAKSNEAASQSLLELDGGIKILVDVGWNDDFDATLLKQLEKHVPTLSFILLTHATSDHLGAYAHCCKHIPLFSRVPVYATEPVIALGRTLLQDVYASTPLAASILAQSVLSEAVYTFRDGSAPSILLQPPTQVEIAGYFNRIHSLKYSQPHEPSPTPSTPPLIGLTITAYSAGHTLGGTIWHIQYGLESVVYAVDWNQAREHILSGAAWLGGIGASEVIEGLRRPTALICSSKGSQRVALTGGRKKRDELLLQLIKETLQNGGTVLIPSDSSARVLELAYLLEDAWTQAKGEDGALRQAQLYMASASGNSTIYNARRMLEWMDSDIVREFENQAAQMGKNADDKQVHKTSKAPFEFAFLKVLERKSQVNRALSREGPKVIIASDSSLEWGFSRGFLEYIAHDERNLVILTERTSQVSKTHQGVGRKLYDVWSQKSGIKSLDDASEDPPAKAFGGGGAEIIGRHVRVEQLAGQELSVYQQYLAQQRQILTTLNADRGGTTLEVADIAEDDSSESSESTEDEDEEQQGKALNVTAVMAHGRHKLGLTDAELGIDILIRRKGHYDWDVLAKRGRERIFPFVTTKRNQRADEYGDIIRPEDYLRAEEKERDDADGVEDTRNGATKEAAVGEKRKWDEVGADSTPGKRLANGTNKRRRADENRPEPMSGVLMNGDVESEADESEDEEDELTGPLKAIFSTKSISLNLRLAYVDFSGLHDKRSLQMLIPLIRPRKLILVGGEPDETMALESDCRQLLSLDTDGADHSTDILTPAIGVLVDASVDTNAWSVKLSKSLLKRLHWQNVRGLGVVALSACLRSGEEDSGGEIENIKKKLKTGNEKVEGQFQQNGVQATPILDTVALGMSSISRTAAQPIHVGDIRLADLRKALQAEHNTAEFRGEGTLVINNSVAVRKSGTGRIEVEGMVTLGAMGRLDGTFYATKRKVYDMLAVVSGA